MSYLRYIFLFLVCTTAMATECPTGFVAIPDNSLLVNNTCPPGYVPAGTLPACPFNTPCLLTCPFATHIVTSQGASVNVNPTKETGTALHISHNGTTCFVSLSQGKTPNAINIKIGDTIYHAVN